MNKSSEVILIAGGTGLIGSHLYRSLKNAGHELRVLSRKPGEYNDMKGYKWSPSKNEIDESAIKGVTIVINLAGAGIADKRWTQERKKLIIESRVKAAETFEKYMKEGLLNPRLYISASAVGYYGDRGSEELTEDSVSGDDFLAHTTLKWEKSADKLKAYTKVIKLRIGIVLSLLGGALPQMAGPQRFGVAPLLGGGEQYMPWIHIDDISGIFYFLIENQQAEGVYNAVSPNPIQQKEMVASIAEGLNRPAVKVPAPTFGLKLIMGEMAALVLNSNRVVPKRLIEMGYNFKYQDPIAALKDLKDRKI